MRIFNGHDYYDSAQAYGHDPSVNLIREIDKKVYVKDPGVPEVLFGQVSFRKSEKKYRPTSSAGTWWGPDTEFKTKKDLYYSVPMQLIFCGKRYLGVKIAATSDLNCIEYIWSNDQMDEFVRKFEGLTWNILQPSRWVAKDNHLFQVVDCTAEEMKYLFDNRISIMVCAGDRAHNNNNGEWLINPPILKDIKFFRVFDAVQAFQELDMWVSGFLGMPANEMVEIADKDKIHKHGYDRWSFRTKVK